MINFLRVILLSILLKHTKPGKVKRFMELYRDNARVNRSTLLRKDMPSLSSCTHACMVHTECKGIVYCDVDTRWRCKLLKTSQHEVKERDIVYAKKCSIYYVHEILWVSIANKNSPSSSNCNFHVKHLQRKTLPRIPLSFEYL